MAGHMGAEQVTTQNLEIVRVDAERNLLLDQGCRTWRAWRQCCCSSGS